MGSKRARDLGGLKGAYSGKRGFIVASGPSLAFKDLAFLRDEVTIGVNLSSLLLDQWGVEPAFNLVADKYVVPRFPHVFEKLLKGKQTKKIIVASACETYPHDLVDEETYFSPKKLPQEVIGFNKDPVSDGFYRGKTVTFDALQLAFFLGFDEVYVIGMDMTSSHNWGYDGHSYELQKHPDFADLEFPRSDSPVIQRGLPGNPQYWDLINNYMSAARKAFEEAGRVVVNDDRSALETFSKEDVLRKYGRVQRVVAFVPAKGTSRRVEGKNMKVLGDKPLFLHILDTLLQCRTIDEAYLDTESDRIFDLAEGRHHQKLRREKQYATNATDGNQLLLLEASRVPSDIYVQALPTAPFLTPKTIDHAVFHLVRNPSNDSVFAATRHKFYMWDTSGKPQYDTRNIPHSYTLDDTIVEAMSLYAIRHEALFRTRSRIGDCPHIFTIPHLESIDIDTEEDFRFAEVVYRGLKGENDE